MAWTYALAGLIAGLAIGVMLNLKFGNYDEA